MGSIIFKEKRENLYKAIERNSGLVVIYGINCANMILQDALLKVDFFVDKRAAEIKNINGIRVIAPKDLEEIVTQTKQKVTIIICIGPGAVGTINSIYNDIVALDINADVFDYFTNEFVFLEETFVYKGKKYPLYEHPFNCGYKDARMTERAVEMSLAKEWIDNCEGEIVEVGAVTPYYFTSDKIVEIVDPMDGHTLVTKQLSVFDCDLKDRNVLSISTIEHIGVGDYGFQEEHDAVEGLLKILNESKHCLITVPFGFNELLDAWILKNRKRPELTVLTRALNNVWEELGEKENINDMLIGVNGLVVICK